MEIKKLCISMALLFFAVIYIEGRMLSAINENSYTLQSERNELKLMEHSVGYISRTEKLCIAASSDASSEIPNEFPDENKFYSVILKELSNHRFKDATVIKSGDKGDAFLISGSGDYWQLVQFIASFRKSGMLCRVSQASITGETDNAVSFKITAEAVISGDEQEKQGK